MEAIYESSKLIAQCLQLLNTTTGISEEDLQKVIKMLQISLDKLVDNIK